MRTCYYVRIFGLFSRSEKDSQSANMRKSMINTANSASPLTSAQGGPATGREAASFQADFAPHANDPVGGSLQEPSGRPMSFACRVSCPLDGVRAVQLVGLATATLLMM